MYKLQIKKFKHGWPYQIKDDFSVCGSGSMIINCQEWIQEINKMIDEYDIKLINDIGCGDLNYIKETSIKEKKINYLGYDYIVRNIKDPYFSIFKDSLNIATDKPRNCDLCICKDVLNHLNPQTQIIPALENIKETSKFLIITNYTNLKKNYENNNIIGHWNPINFNIYPYNLEKYLITSIKTKHNNDLNLFLSIYKFK